MSSQNLQSQRPKPPFPSQQQEVPGLESQITPKPDYGENSYRGSGKLQGKAAIITGGDSGIGPAVALAFAREGADVLIAYLNEEPDAQETVRIVEKEGRRCIAIAGDIQQEAHCQQLVERAEVEFGKLDIRSEDEWEKSINVKLGCLLCTGSGTRHSYATTRERSFRRGDPRTW